MTHDASLAATAVQGSCEFTHRQFVATSTPTGRLIPLEAASDLVSLDVKTLRRYIAAGKLRGFRIGPRALRVLEDEVRALAKPIPTVAS